jgi:AcrR family transcriptional regulator
MNHRDLRPGNIKVTRDDWLRLAQETLIAEGVDNVRILSLGRKLGISRSSFYWYFKSHQDLLDQLLDKWRVRNTPVIVEHASRPSRTITEGVLNVFECWINPNLFDPRLDFAVRAWARRAPDVRGSVNAADTERLDALSAMFLRHGYSDEDAKIRARVLYLTQIAYFSLEFTEAMPSRLRQVPYYVCNFTGHLPAEQELRAFEQYVTRMGL